MSSFYVGIYFAPYRFMELENLKSQHFDKNTDNYIDFEKRTIHLYIHLYEVGKLKIMEQIKKDAYEMKNSPTVLQSYVKFKNVDQLDDQL